MSSNTIVLLTLIGYKLLLLGIGFWASKRVHSEADFFIAGQGEGRGLGAWTAGLSYAASTSSAWVLLGYTGMVFTKGAVALWLVPGIFAGYAMTWLVMGPRLNAETSEKGHITIVDFMVGDVGDKWRRKIGIVCALMILFCFVFYISSQFQAAGNALSSVFGISSVEAILLGATVIVIYCLLGGFWAASITDALQAAVMLLACIIVPVMAVIHAGGFGNIVSGLHEGQAPAYFSFTGGAAGMLGIGAALGLLGTGLGALGQPQLLNRIMATKDAATRRKGAAITIGWGLVIYSGLTVLAFTAKSLAMDVEGEKLFFEAAEAFLPAVLAGVVIAAVLSAVMSTVDSLLLAAASAVSHDMGLKYESPQKALLFGRVAMVAVAILAVLMTLYLPQDIFSRVLFSWVALGAAFGPTILTRCLGWKVKGGFVLSAILAGFFIAVYSSNQAGVSFDMTEKWLSWVVGLLILWVGKQRA
jgi:sodium/proline symporter